MFDAKIRARATLFVTVNVAAVADDLQTHETDAKLRLHPGRQQRWPETPPGAHGHRIFRPSCCSPSPPCYGGLSGGPADLWFTLAGDWDLARVAFHIPLGMVSFYIALSWLGAAIGTSPHRSIGTVFLAPLFVFLAQWAYGQGVIKAWREIRRTGGRAGEGAQIDDRVRTA